ncbi:MAG TPA: hypothetical protein VN605_11295 [Thermoanaerobaculia bacterium]|nr:hypothetical protein [Thermoanaerobaculia bacterium]
MRPITKIVARSVLVLLAVLALAVPDAGAVTRDGGDPELGAPRPRIIRIVKKIVKSLGDLLSDPKP